MTPEEVEAFAMALPATTKVVQWGGSDVYKVGGKVFAICGLPGGISFKVTEIGFLARIYEYQFYRAACRQAGWKGPLNRCSVYGNKEVGARFGKMLAMGQSRPWPEALEAFTGEKDIDATAIADYFAPLNAWLTEQNKGQQCGW